MAWAMSSRRARKASSPAKRASVSVWAARAKSRGGVGKIVETGKRIVLLGHGVRLSEKEKGRDYNKKAV